MQFNNILEQIQAYQPGGSRYIGNVRLNITIEEANRLVEVLSVKGTDRQWFADRINSLTDDLKRALDRETELHRTMSGDVWYWEADGDNYLESLSCPVVIQANDLRALLAEKRPQTHAEDIVCLDEDADEDGQLLQALERFASKLRKRVENPWSRIFGRAP